MTVETPLFEDNVFGAGPTSMICEQCHHEGRVGERPRGTGGADPFGRLQCQACGAVLPAYAAALALRDKLVQLSRFGLAETSPPGDKPSRKARD